MGGEYLDSSSLFATLIAVLQGLYRLLTHPDTGSLAAIAGLLVSLYVLYTLKDLKARLQFAARVPKILDDLSSNASTLSQTLQDYAANPGNVDVVLSVCVANLESIKQRVKGSAQKIIGDLIMRIQQYLSAPAKTKENVWTIYTTLNGVIQTLRNITEDYRVE